MSVGSGWHPSDDERIARMNKEILAYRKAGFQGYNFGPKSVYNWSQANTVLGFDKNRLQRMWRLGQVCKEDKDDNGEWQIPDHRLARYYDGFYANEWRASWGRSPLVSSLPQDEAATFLLMSADVLATHLDENLIPHHTVGDEKYILREDLERFMKANSYEPVSLFYASQDSPSVFHHQFLPDESEVFLVYWRRAAGEHHYDPHATGQSVDEHSGWESDWFCLDRNLPPDHPWHPKHWCEAWMCEPTA